jgi:hypothetical protein
VDALFVHEIIEGLSGSSTERIEEFTMSVFIYVHHNPVLTAAIASIRVAYQERRSLRNIIGKHVARENSEKHPLTPFAKVMLYFRSVHF